LKGEDGENGKKQKDFYSVGSCNAGIHNDTTTAFAGPTKAPTKDGTSYKDLFLELYGKIKDPKNGYFSPDEGIPYHSIETLIVEAPDYGHVTTSEAFSYYVWLEAMYGNLTGNWSE